jgi:hypothetical protein
MQDGIEEQLTQSFHLSIAPVSSLDGSIPTPRRSSVNGDVYKARRISSDMSVPQLTPPRSVYADVFDTTLTKNNILGH